MFVHIEEGWTAGNEEYLAIYHECFFTLYVLLCLALACGYRVEIWSIVKMLRKDGGREG